MRWIVDSVHEDVARVAGSLYAPIDIGRGGGDDPPCAVQIVILERTPDDLDVGALDFRADIRRHHRHPGASMQQRLEFAGCHSSTANHDNVAALEVQEGREHLTHTDAGTLRRDPMTRSKSA